ncbi:unnamed protein product [Auanema sp. JU1783]|nr:unnamed protein product [Auanema sp. JU1783]
MVQLITRKVSYPGLPSKSNPDFRKEYKGSVLEEKFQESKKISETWKVWKYLSDWFFTKPSEQPTSTVDLSPIEMLPPEMLHQILKEVDGKTLLQCREVSRRWKCMAEHIQNRQNSLPVLNVSRLMVQGTKKGGLELRWVDYDRQVSRNIVLSQTEIQNCIDLRHAFKRFAIQRLVITKTALTDELITFLRFQMSETDLSTIHSLSLVSIDMQTAKSLTLHKLLAMISKSLKELEIQNCCNMNPMSLTDSHIEQLNPTLVRRITIDGVKFGKTANKNRKTEPALHIGDKTLQRFAEHGNFPILLLDQCSVSTDMVCNYTQTWLSHVPDEHTGLPLSQICTVKRCPRVQCSEFENECQKRGLYCANRRGSESLVIYNIQKNAEKTMVTLSLAMSPPENSQDSNIKPSA